MIQAHQKLPEYLRTQPIPFYPWLRRIAWENIVQLHRQHLLAQEVLSQEVLAQEVLAQEEEMEALTRVQAANQ